MTPTGTTSIAEREKWQPKPCAKPTAFAIGIRRRREIIDIHAIKGHSREHLHEYCVEENMVLRPLPGSDPASAWEGLRCGGTWDLWPSSKSWADGRSRMSGPSTPSSCWSSSRTWRPWSPLPWHRSWQQLNERQKMTNRIKGNRRFWRLETLHIGGT